MEHGRALENGTGLIGSHMALGQWRAKNVVHHLDHGTQYTSTAFGLRRQEANVEPSMETVGDAYDNALRETFFSTLERELLARRRFEPKAQARMAIFEFIEGSYNANRRHSRLGRISPIEFVLRHSTDCERAVTQRPARLAACEAPAHGPVDKRL